MRVWRLLFFIAVCLALTSAPISASSRADSVVTVAGVLEAADYPLSQEQANTFGSIKIGDSFFDIYELLYDTLREEQKTALVEWLGPWQGYGGRWHKTPRYLHWIILLENNGCPVTQSQVHDLKQLPTDPPSPDDHRSREERNAGRKKPDEILTKEQMTVLKEAYAQQPKRPASQHSSSGNRPVASAPAGNAKVIIEALQREFEHTDLTLTDGQKEKMTAGFNHQNPRDLRGVLSVLTSEQKSYFIAKYRENLADSEHPMTEEQEALIMNFGPGSPYNGWFDIFTQEQKDHLMQTW